MEAPSTPTPSATRSFNPATVAPGGTVTVTIQAANYGQAGGITETLPAGFSYGGSSLSASQVNESGQNVGFTLQGDTSFTYTVTVSSTPGPYDFAGTLRDFDKTDHTVGGATRVTVRRPTPGGGGGGGASNRSAPAFREGATAARAVAENAGAAVAPLSEALSPPLITTETASPSASPAPTPASSPSASGRARFRSRRAQPWTSRPGVPTWLRRTLLTVATARTPSPSPSPSQMWRRRVRYACRQRSQKPE